MVLNYVTTEKAQAATGLRMIVVGGVPSPWSEAAKGIFHVKRLSWLPVYLDHQDRAQTIWAQTDSAPVVFWKDKAPLSETADIVALAQRIAPEPDLLPASMAPDILAFIDLLTAPNGLGWQRRLQQIHAGMRGQEGGFHPKIADYLGKKYGYDTEAGEMAAGRADGILKRVSSKLAESGDFLFGNTLTAADIYCAAFMALFAPLPEELCAMRPSTRRVFEHISDPVRDTLSAGLLLHRDRVYRDFLETPLSL